MGGRKREEWTKSGREVMNSEGKGRLRVEGM